MKSRLLTAMALFSAAIVVMTGFFYWSYRDNGAADEKAEQIVALNEIGQLLQTAITSNDTDSLPRIEAKIEALQVRLRSHHPSGYDTSRYPALLLLAGASCLLFLIMVFGYVHAAILRPFDKMKGFAERIAAGDFDLPLNYERSNYFGAFTWAFDSMRREITKARSCEKEAVANNKTVIATLSHDIKTPIASIRAYAEALEAHMDSTPEKRARYLEVMIRKCREVARLTDDLFLHSLSDLDKLKIQPERVELGGLLASALEEVATEREAVVFIKPSCPCYAWVDRNRFVQVVENIVNNAGKYAKTRCQVTIENSEGQLFIRFRDYGGGIPDEDLPFIFQKFYRGKNSGSEQGSGLGLYMVKYVMDQLKGRVELQNRTDGLDVILSLPEAGA